MNRRHLLAGFITTAAGLLAPEPVRAYSFLPGIKSSELAFYGEGIARYLAAVAQAKELIRREWVAFAEMQTRGSAL